MLGITNVTYMLIFKVEKRDVEINTNISHVIKHRQSYPFSSKIPSN